MGISVYVDGSGGPNGRFGFFVKETGESFYEKKPEITNNQAEYMAIISALNKFVDSNEEIKIFSDSKNTVNQLNHEFAINNEQLRDLAREAWSIMGKFSNLSIQWVPRKENLAGKMLGS
jgi:ribonuclease HI